MANFLENRSNRGATHDLIFACDIII